METYFSGDVIDWLNQIPEEIIDSAIKILDLDPDKEMKPKGYSPPGIDLSWLSTLKYCLWEDIVHVVRRWGMPSPSTLKTSPSELKKHAAKIQGQIDETISVLKNLEYPYLFQKGTMTKEFKVGYGLRQVSEVLRANKEGLPGQFFAPGCIADSINSNPEQIFYPIDNDIKSALIALENITKSATKLLQDPAYVPAKQGKKKKGKDNYDTLLWSLCHLYSKYTGEIPTSSAREDGTATGKIIPFLRLILEQSSYSYEKTDWALEKKIRELKDHPTHGKLWQVAKN